MNKEVNIDSERKIKIITNDEEVYPRREITESFQADSIDCAHYTLSQGETFHFNASLDLDLETEENKNLLVFIINVDHPLYFPLLHLLNNEREITINDDKDHDNKYLNITNDDDLIKLNFVDKTKNRRITDKFNITFDTKFEYFKDKRSIKNNNKKKRLFTFFDEATKVLLEDCHQISFEEYDVKKRVLERERNIS